MVFRAFTTLGLLVLAATFACSSGDAQPAPAAGGKGGTGGSPGQGGSSALAGSAGSSPGQAGTHRGGEGTGGSTPGQGGEAALAGTGSGLPGDGGAGGTPSGEGGGPSDGGQVIDECLSAPVVAETRTEALALSGAGLSLAIVRRVDPDAFGTSGTTVWLPQRFGLVRGAVAECISDVQALDYTVSHHNFDDVMTASYGDETWIFSQTREDYGVPAMFSLEAREGGALVWGPVTLTLVACQELLQGQSCLAGYQE